MPDPSAPPGVRVVVDLRALQEPDRAPVTAAYLGGLLRAFAADPLEGETFVALLTAGLADPTDALPGLALANKRWLPPTRGLRSGALTLDPFLLRGASIGTSRGHGGRAVYHLAGSGLPLGSGLPVVATLLDLAPWELPHAYQASPAARFGQRLRGRILRDSAAVIVGTPDVGRSAARLLHLRPERLHVVPLAADPAFAAVRDDPEAFAAGLAAERHWLGLPERYLTFFGRYDGRSDLPGLFDALRILRGRDRPADLPSDVNWPPTLLLIGANPDDRAALARSAARRGVGELLAYAPYLPPSRLATLVAGARAALLPVVSEAAGMPAIDALACGTPVVASSVGALPAIVGAAGILVEPRDPDRLARAIEAIWSEDALSGRLRDAATRTMPGSAAGATRRRSAAGSKPGGAPSGLAQSGRAESGAARWTWADAARATRAVYAAAAGAPGPARPSGDHARRQG